MHFFFIQFVIIHYTEKMALYLDKYFPEIKYFLFDNIIFLIICLLSIWKYFNSYGYFNIMEHIVKLMSAYYKTLLRINWIVSFHAL